MPNFTEVEHYQNEIAVHEPTLHFQKKNKNVNHRHMSLTGNAQFNSRLLVQSESSLKTVPCDFFV